MKKLSTTNLRWWGIALTLAAQSAFGQLERFSLPTDAIMTRSSIVTFNSLLYMVVYNGPFEGTRLCAFDGRSFTLVPNPRANDVVSPDNPLQVYHGDLYVIITQWTDAPIIPPDPALYRFDGTSYTPVDIPYDFVPTTVAHSDLEVYDGKLYLDVAETELSPNTAWVTYDGTNFSFIEFPEGMISNGTAGMTVYHDKLFCMMKRGRSAPPQLVSYDGTSFHIFTIPNLLETPAVVYNDKLMLTQSVDGHEHLIQFDDSGASGIASASGTVPRGGGKEAYNGSMFLRMADASTPDNGNLLVAYDGTEFTRITTLNALLSPTQDLEVWHDRLWFSAGRDFLYSYRPVVLDPVYEFEHIDINLNTMGRGWCWNEIIVDWTIIPVCLTPPDCPEGGSPLYTTLLDKDKVVWQSIEKKPFALTVPVADNPYTFSLAAGKLGIPQDMVTVDASLVGMGIEGLKLGLKPQTGNVQISLSTKKGQSVPVTISFLNAKGVAVWQENVTAPVEKQLTIQSAEPGVKFLMAPTGATLESAGITATSYYPNPFDGKITVDLQTRGDKVPVRVTIDDPNGKRVVEAEFTAPVKQSLELKDKKQGFYVLTFWAGRASRQVLIELK